MLLVKSTTTMQPFGVISINIRVQNGKEAGGTSSKRICYVATTWRTLSAFVLDTAAYLHDHGGYEISLVCDDDSSLMEEIRQDFMLFPVAMKRGINASGLIAIFKLFRIFKREGFDIIQYCTPNASFYAAIAGLLARVPVRLYCQWGIRYVGFSGFRRRVFRALETITCRASTWIEPDSVGNLEYSRSQGLYSSSKSSVVWNGSASGVDLCKFDAACRVAWRDEIRERLGIDPSTFVAGFVGRVTRDKGVNDLLAAWMEFSREHDDCVLIIVGSVDLGELDIDLWRWGIGSSSVIYQSRTPNPEKFYAAFDVFVLPSHREGFGSVVVEAQAMGTPVVVTDIPGPLDAMQPGITGFVAAVRDPISLSKAIHILYADRNLAQRMGQEGIRLARDSFDAQRHHLEVLMDRDALLARGSARCTRG